MNEFIKRPWGKWIVLREFKLYKIKEIIVNPQKQLSLQYHNYRSETWFIEKGYAKIIIDNNMFIAIEGSKIHIPKKAVHRLKNRDEKKILKVIEIQHGSYLEEDDIVRLEDDYGRINTR